MLNQNKSSAHVSDAGVPQENLKIMSLSNLGYVVVLASAICVADGLGTLKGTIRDSEEAAVKGARILVHWDSAGAAAGLRTNVGLDHDLTVQSDVNGQFAVELPPGFYDVYVSAVAFSPHCRKIRIKAGETATYQVNLRADPLVTKELGGEMGRSPGGPHEAIRLGHN